MTYLHWEWSGDNQILALYHFNLLQEEGSLPLVIPSKTYNIFF